MDLNQALQNSKLKLENAINKGEEIASAYTDLLLGNNENIAAERMDICKRCPLFKKVTKSVHICNPTMSIENIATKEVIKGCGCILEAKTRNLESYCPASKWTSINLSSEPAYLTKDQMNATLGDITIEFTKNELDD